MQLEKTISTEIVDKDKKVMICDIRIARDITKGTTLFIKSEMFEEFFKQNSNTIDGNISDCGGIVRNTKRNIVPRTVSRCFDYTTDSLVNDDGDYNLSFLRCEGISEGLIFPIRGLTTKQQADQYKTNAQTVIQKVYNELMKSYTIISKISVMETTI